MRRGLQSQLNTWLEAPAAPDASMAAGGGAPLEISLHAAVRCAQFIRRVQFIGLADKAHACGAHLGFALLRSFFVSGPLAGKRLTFDEMLGLPCDAGEHYIVKDKTYGFSCQKCDLKGDCDDIKVAPCRGLELVMEPELQPQIEEELRLKEEQEQVSKDEATAKQLLLEDQQKLLEEELAQAEMMEALLQMQLEEQTLLDLQAEQQSLAAPPQSLMPPPSVPVRQTAISPLY